ncbi:MAG: phosphoglucosamine mutase [Deltaproteobacteria bacterium]|nr:phosphoglucosamine mutase [Deltaproteobacteria bacterium]
MGKFFGTDGVRGLVNREPLTPMTITKLGLAIAAFLRSTAIKEDNSPSVIIGRDTRLSGDMVESALMAGLTAGGVNIALAGVIPTPAISYLTPEGGFDAGIVISASHNPFGDNGIKLFSHQGCKLATAAEEAIEAHLLATIMPLAFPTSIGTSGIFALSERRYIDFLLRAYPLSQKPHSMKVILDCANGSTYKVAPAVFAELGVDVIAIHNEPNGKNINLNCGSQHTASLSQTVVAQQASCGFAFDGDGDRVIAVDAHGRTLTGDQLITLCALWLKRQGRLTNNIVVRTVMSNQGMTNALKDHGIDYLITDVGDKFVAEGMDKSGAAIGGEDSGHIIFANTLPTGDGILTALNVLAVMVAEKRPLAQLADQMEVLPQVLISVETAARTDFMGVPTVATAINVAQKELGETGRVLVRYSGTQTLCRVMVEAPDFQQAKTICQRIAETIVRELG